MITVETISSELAEELCRKIIADLPEYFGLPEANEDYAIGVRSCINLAAKVEGVYGGLISIDFPYPTNANIYWMAVLQKLHGQGIGKILAESAFYQAKVRGARTISVETLAPQEADKNYLRTYQFYHYLGFSPLFNLKPVGYEWNMVYMVKPLGDITPKAIKETLIRALSKKDIPIMVKAFSSIGWHKPAALFKRYWKEAEDSQRHVWVALVQGQFAGYVTLKWESEYLPFKHQNIPEIMDLNVLPYVRKIGIGSMLLDTAEQEAATKSAIVGIGVGLYAGSDGGYGSAQRLYVKRGYIPDGKGVTYNYQFAIPGNSYPLNDNLVLWFTKKLN